MAEKERYPHLFIGKDYRSESGYTRHPQNQSGRPKTARTPVVHAARIEGRLQTAWAEAEATRIAVGTSQPEGLYLEFEIEPTYQLPVSPLDSRSKGIGLRNVRVVKGEDDVERTLATVFVPHAQRELFLEKIEQYGSEGANEDLVASVEDIRAAVLEDFWTHGSRDLPGYEPEWVEIWLHDPTPTNPDPQEDALVSEVVEHTRMLLEALEIREQEDRGVLHFPERSVMLVHATGEQLAELVKASDDLAEIRPAADLASFFLDELSRTEQAQLIDDLLGRVQHEDSSDVAVCILDGGINWGHPVLSPVLHEGDCHTVKPEWGKHDSLDTGHGTLMAGVGAYGDIQRLLDNNHPVTISHVLESSKLLPPSPGENEHHLWGDYTSQAVSRAETTERINRVICMAVSSKLDMDRGRPSSWSGMVDQIISGAMGDARRLFIIAAGNTKDQAIHKIYPDGLLFSTAHNPSQAWNALAVGGYTDLVNLPGDVAGDPLAAHGEISPFTSTSASWDNNRWPIKPEIVLEAGNAVKDEFGGVYDQEDLAVLTTNAHYQSAEEGYFSHFNGTSAASARAAWMGAKIHAKYPEIWPETVRALMVHSAEWTDEMKAQFLKGNAKGHYERLLRVCGYGVPSLERALSCPQSSLNLISEASIQPYGKKEGASNIITNEMHLYELPWPRDQLLDLGETEVRMRITLSYFVEPSPGEIGWKNRYRYASHAFRFDLNLPGENAETFRKRVNKQALEGEEKKPSKGTAPSKWKIGPNARDVGSIHSDIWEGSAADLATSNTIAVYPVGGWWKDRRHLNKWDSQTRYSLVVSIETPSLETDIYTPVATQVGIPTPVPIEIEIGV